MARRCCTLGQFRSLLFLWRFFVYFQKKILISAPLFASNSHLQRDEGRQQTQWEFGGIFNVFCEMEAFIHELKVAHFCCFSSAALNCFLIFFLSLLLFLYPSTSLSLYSAAEAQLCFLLLLPHMERHTQCFSSASVAPWGLLRGCSER